MKIGRAAGLVHVYTGNGKGKTTAALGLALRASGAGLRVYINQFMKGAPSGESRAVKKIKNIKIDQCGRGCLIKASPTRSDIEFARNGLHKVRAIIRSGCYDLVILDEAALAAHMGLVDTCDIVDIIRTKPAGLELVITGRGCPKAIIDSADLVTEMIEIRHPYRRGVKARRGIEY